MSDDASFTSPFFSEDADAPHSPYWAARRELAEAARELQAALCTADIAPDQARALASQLRAETATLAGCTHYPGVVEFAKKSGHGSLAVVNHELLAVGGHSHPAAPGIKMWHDNEETRGTVRCSWAYEGPPGHVHGGWIAAIFDHFMGMAHMRGGRPGMTAGLTVRYVAPTPIDATLTLVATQHAVGDRKTQVVAELHHDDRLTATAEALFVRPRHNIFS